jgi:LmbE family N-acetylglucosaminyl deacetylase
LAIADPTTDRPRHVVLSPHPDDAVLSVWHVLASAADVTVVTVFAGIPAPGVVTAHDTARGAADAATLVRRRREEDRRALAVAGRAPVHLDLPDIAYRAAGRADLQAAIAREPSAFIALVAAEPGLRVDPAELASHVAPHLCADGVVHVPAGIGRHPDHRDVASLGALLAARGHVVELYADVPYLFRRGRPSWLGGEPASPADRDVDDALASFGDPATLARDVVQLDSAQVTAKAAAVRCYETEFHLVNEDFGGALDDRALMRYEVSWALPTRSP